MDLPSAALIPPHTPDFNPTKSRTLFTCVNIEMDAGLTVETPNTDAI